ncbi:MAG: branched-chain amino acid aminotransferase [Nitrospirae bacterium]|nr:MAG: branched-chain amino acid aminotransferase [Nitrospirota bacterium]
MLVYLNNGLLPEADAKISVFDHGFLYGDGIYETLRVYNKKVFLIDEHIRRLKRSASLIGLTVPKTDEDIKKIVALTLDANGLREAYVRITISRGEGPIGLDPALCKAPTFVVIANEFKNYPEEYYRDGIAIMVPEVRRNHRAALNPQIKSQNFLNNILAKIEAKAAGAYEAVMLNTDGFLAEGTISNIFFLKDGALCTPAVECGILDGITRALVLDLATKTGIKVREGFYRLEELTASSEVFLTNSTMEVMPVSRINNTPLNPGAITSKLRSLYKQAVSG